MASESDSSVSSDEIDWLGPLGGEECGVYEDIVDCLSEIAEEKAPSPEVFVDIHKNSESKAGSSKIKNKRLTEDENMVVRKKEKREVSYNKFWESKYSVIKGNSQHMAKCTLCDCLFSIGHSGEGDILRHNKTTKHLENIEKAANTQTLKTIFSSQEHNKNKLQIAECGLIYHSVKHSHSYLSVDCLVKILSKLFPDSQTAKGMTLGRTKGTKIIINVLAPYTHTKIIEDLQDHHPFSISSDASNKGNIKTFPLIVRYFKKQEGTKTMLLNFYSSPSEKSKDISSSINTHLIGAALSIADVTAYCADNASVNFGKNQSVFTEIQKLNDSIVPIGCVCHIIHNAAKNGQKALRYDIELIVIKCYNEFSSSTKKSEELKEFFEFCDSEWSELLKSVPTRWLSLAPAAERLLKKFQPVKSYFLSMASPPAILQNFFQDEFAEAYLGFIVNVGYTMQTTIQKLQSDKVLILELHETMVLLKRNLQTKLDEEFYGAIARNIMLRSDDGDKIVQFKRQANAFLERTISYLEKWYQYKNNRLENLSCMILKKSQTLALEKYLKIASDFKIHIDEDMLFEEFVKLKYFIQNDLNEEEDVNQRWVAFFKNNSPANNFERLCNTILSIPHSNASSERIFSLMTTAWRKDRNKLDIKTLEAELMIKTNFKLSCKDFIVFLKSGDADDILRKVSSCQKYVNSI